MFRKALAYIGNSLAVCIGIILGAIAFFTLSLFAKPELFWQALGSLATLAAAVFTLLTAIWTRKAAEAARDTVREMKQERLDARTEKENERVRNRPLIQLESLGYMEHKPSDPSDHSDLYIFTFSNVRRNRLLRAYSDFVFEYISHDGKSKYKVFHQPTLELHGSSEASFPIHVLTRDMEAAKCAEINIYGFLKAFDVDNVEANYITRCVHFMIDDLFDEYEYYNPSKVILNVGTFNSREFGYIAKRLEWNEEVFLDIVDGIGKSNIAHKTGLSESVEAFIRNVYLGAMEDVSPDFQLFD